MRFRAHETFAIRKGWLHKGMKNVVNNPRVFRNIRAWLEYGKSIEILVAGLGINC